MRIYAEVEDKVLQEIERTAENNGISKKQLILKAIERYLHPLDQATIRNRSNSISYDQATIKDDQKRSGTTSDSGAAEGDKSGQRGAQGPRGWRSHSCELMSTN